MSKKPKKRKKKIRQFRPDKILFGIVIISVLIVLFLNYFYPVQHNNTSDINNQETVPIDVINTESQSQQNQVTPEPVQSSPKEPESNQPVNLNNIPPYSGKPFVSINSGIPFFTNEEITTKSFENYAPFDNLGRCGVCTACIGKDIMPTEKRGDISSVKPSGWVNKKYDFVDGGYVYNRCHLIGFQLAGENANKYNLITGTRYLNVQGMLPFENMVADYVKETNNHVMYRVTPIYDGDNLVASGVLMEAYSVEDDGEDIAFNVYCYNVQPGVEIDYKTGNTWLANDNPNASQNNETYVVNKNSRKFHLENCENAAKISDKNKKIVKSTYDEMIRQGYDPCGLCLSRK